MWKARSDKEIVGAAAYDYLMFSGYIMMGFYWLMMAKKAFPKIKTDSFYKSKFETAQFYFDHLLPKAQGHAATMLTPTSSIMKPSADDI